MPVPVELTFDLAVEFLSFLRVDVDNELGDLNLLCLQGLSPTGASPTVIGSNELSPNDNALGQYNDVVALVFRDENNEGQVASLVGTTDPGRFYTDNPLNSLGAAHLTFGQHLYVEGKHRGKRALRALNETNRIWRDRDGDAELDPTDAVFIGSYGINIHAGGKSSYIGRWSAGCINIAGGFDGAPYQRFLELVDTHVQSRPVVRVTAWRGRDLLQFADKGWDHRPTLVMGIKNQWVAEMQRHFRAKGHALRVDGDWRERTTTAVLEFQTEVGLKADGWCGPKTWQALLN